VLRSSSGFIPSGQPPSTVPPDRPVRRMSVIFMVGLPLYTTRGLMARAGYCRRRGTAREIAPREAGRRVFLACGADGQFNQASPVRTEGGRAMRRCVVMLALAAAAWALPVTRGADQDVPEGFQPLFNGKDLSGWTVNEGGKIDRWGAEDGILFTT